MAPVAEDAAGTQLTILAPVGDGLGEAALRAAYAYPDDLPRCWVRANMIASADGGTAVDGRSGGLAGPGDSAVFAVLRELADVVLVGAGTVRSEGYSGARLSAAQRAARRERGQRELPPLAVVSRSASLPADAPVFTDTEVAPLLITAAARVAQARDRFGDTAEVLDGSADDPAEVDHAAVLALLAGRGLRRVLLEGGPALLGGFVAAELLDELCLTVAPTVLGGSSDRVAVAHRAATTRLRRASLLTDDAGYLYVRYLRATPGDD